MSEMPSFARGRQQGVALVIGLIMLLVLTLISLSAVKMTTQQQQISTNAEYAALTFAAAESAIRSTYNEVLGRSARPDDAPGPLLATTMRASEVEDPTWPTRGVGDIQGLDVRGTIRYVGQGRGDGQTINIGSGGLIFHYFVIEGRAALNPEDPLSAAFHRQGIRRAAPQ